MGNKDIFNFLMNSSDSNLYGMTDSTGQNILIKAVLSQDIPTIERLIKKEGVIVDQ